MSTSELFSGRITSFQRAQAFGLITLDDGTVVKFDAGICTMVPEEGAAVRLRVGPAKWGGGLKALFVEPAGTPGAPPTPRARSFDELLAAVQAEHLAAGLTEQLAGELAARRPSGRRGAGAVLELLDAYWSGDPARARSDGYLRRAPGLPAEGDDVLGELAALLPGARLPRQLRWAGRGAAIPIEQGEITTAPYGKLDAAELLGALDALDDAAFSGAESAAFSGAEGAALGGVPFGGPAAPAAPALVVRDPDGRERELPIASLDDVIEVANAALRRAGDGRRVYRLETGGEWHAYLALASDRALRLASALPFGPAPADVP